MIKTQGMLTLEEFFLVLQTPVLLFVRLVCITGVTAIGHQFQPKTINQLYDLFVRTVKLLYRHHAIALNFAFDDDGLPLSNHELFLRCKVPTLRDFTKQVGELVGDAHFDKRISQGYSFRNIVVKDILVYWLYSPAVRARLGGFDALIESLDRIKTLDDSLASIESFRKVAEPVVQQSMKNVTERTALALQESSPAATNLLIAAYLMNQGNASRGGEV